MKELVATPIARGRIVAAVILSIFVLRPSLWPLALVIAIAWAVFERRFVQGAWNEIVERLRSARSIRRVLDAIWTFTAQARADAEVLHVETRVRWTQAPLAARIERVAFWIAVFLWVAYCGYYVASPLPPYEFFSDIGGYINTIGRMGVVATSPAAIGAMFNWQTWNDSQAFVLFSSGTVYLALPLELLLRDPFRTIKLVQAIQLTVAFFGASWLYSLIFAKNVWRWMAGWLYAAMPLCSLGVRSEGDFGSIFALMPVALALSIVLARRFGPRSLPLSAIGCSFVASAFYPEFLLVAGLPMLVTIVLLFAREGMLRWKPALAAVAAFAAFPAFLVLPTLIGPHPLWFSDAYLSAMRDGSQQALFAQGGGEIAALISRESLLSADITNASSGLVFALPAGIALWLLVGSAIVFAFAKGTWRLWWPLAAMTLACLLLALGPNLAYIGTPLWQFVANLPVLGTFRTPDRFMMFAPIVLAIAATRGARQLWLSPARLIGIALAIVPLAGYLLFGIEQRTLGFGSIEANTPNATAVSSIVQQIGGRSVSFVVPKDGSIFDLPPYTPLNPTVPFGWDLYTRYLAGDGGAGLLRRAAVRSIVTTPPWALNPAAGMLPDTAIPFLTSPLLRSVQGAGQGPAGPQVFSFVDPLPDIRSVTPVCFWGGQRSFEIAASSPSLDSLALVHSGPCKVTIYGEDPLDRYIPQVSVASWSSADLFNGGEAVPAEPPFHVDRFSLTAKWFSSQTYQGESLLSAVPYITQQSAASRVFPFRLDADGHYSLAVRVRGLAVLRTVGDDGRQVAGISDSAEAFRWVVLHLGAMKSGMHMRRIEVDAVSRPSLPIALDEVAIVPDAALDREPGDVDGLMISSHFFAPQLADADRTVSLFPRLQVGAATTIGQGLYVDAKTSVQILNGPPAIVATEPLSRIRFVWTGPSGDYILGAVAQLSSERSTLHIDAGGQDIEGNFKTLDPEGKTEAYGRVHLRTNDAIVVTMNSPSFDASKNTNLLVSLAAARVVPTEPPTSYNTAEEMWHFDNGDLAGLMAATGATRIVDGGDAVAAQGTVIASMEFTPDVIGGHVAATLTVAGAGSTATLQCGSTSAAAAYNVALKQIAFSVDDPDRNGCLLRVTGSTSTNGLKSVDITVSGPELRERSSRQIMDGGRYVWSGAASTAIEIDGRPWPARTIARVAPGIHVLTITRSPLPMRDPIFLRNLDAWEAARPSKAVELAELNDGAWIAQGQWQRRTGYTCDLVNTCFDIASPTNVRHGISPQSGLGWTITLGDIVACLVPIGAALRRRGH